MSSKTEKIIQELENNSIVTQNSQLSFADYIEQNKDEFAKVIPSNMKLDKILRLGIAAYKRKPQLMACTQDSVAMAIMEATSLGLEIDTPMHQCTIVPVNDYKNKCKSAELWIEYEGYVALMYRHQKVISIFASEVYMDDEFDFQYGTDSFLKHKPNGNSISEKISFFYCCVKLVGGHIFRVMTKKQVDNVRDSYSKAYNYNQSDKNTPWNQDYIAMGKKTVIRAINKFVPKTTEVSMAYDTDIASVWVKGEEKHKNIIKGES